MGRYEVKRMGEYCGICGYKRITCRECGRVFCSGGCDEVLLTTRIGVASEWIDGKGNVCVKCLFTECGGDIDEIRRLEKKVLNRIGIKTIRFIRLCQNGYMMMVFYFKQGRRLTG
jgi:hypothetical protein